MFGDMKSLYANNYKSKTIEEGEFQNSLGNTI